MSAWRKLLKASKPFVVVTPNGPTDGGDYGPNTAGTTTAGMQEAMNFICSQSFSYGGTLLHGGKMIVRNGLYAGTSHLKVNQNNTINCFVEIEGESMAFGNGAGVVIRGDSTAVLEIQGGGNLIACNMRNLLLDGNATSQHCLYDPNGYLTNSEVENVWYSNPTLRCLTLLGNPVRNTFIGGGVADISSSTTGIINADLLVINTAFFTWINPTFLMNSSNAVNSLFRFGGGPAIIIGGHIELLAGSGAMNYVIQMTSAGQSVTVDGITIENTPTSGIITSVFFNNTPPATYDATLMVVDNPNLYFPTAPTNITGNSNTNIGASQFILTNKHIIFDRLVLGPSGTPRIRFLTNPIAKSSSTAGASPFTFPLLPYDATYVLTTVGGMTALTLDGQALFNGAFSIGQNVYVAATHTLIATWATTAPVFEILPV